MIYLDNAATTRVCPEAAEAALHYMTEDFGNPSSTHAPGRAARAALRSARAAVASTLGARPEEIFFTAGGTEGDNWAIRCAAHAARRRGRHIISSRTEHDAVLKALGSLEADGYEVTYLSPADDGSIRAEDVLAALRDDTVLVSLMLVNNETGAINDIPAVARTLKKAGSRAVLHTDAVQGYMKLPFTAKSLGADLITLSGHKIHAPKGVGALYVRQGIKLPPLIVGGGQESGQRSGTENLPGICAFAAAAEAYAQDKGARERMASLRAGMIEKLASALPELSVIGGGAAHILCLSLPGYKSEVILNFLDAQGICVSKGSACKKGARSHVLEAMSLPAPVIDGAIRVSLSRMTTAEEADAFCDALIEASGKLLKTL